MKRIALAVGFCALAMGCVSDATKRVNEQNYHIGAELAKVNNPMASDLMENCAEIAKDIGLPKAPAMQYTPELSKQARQDAVSIRTSRTSIMDSIMGVVGGNIPWAVTVIAAALAWWARTRKVLGDKKLLAVYSGVEKVVDDIKASGGEGGAIAKNIVTVMRETASAHNVYPDIKADLQKMRGA